MAILSVLTRGAAPTSEIVQIRAILRVAMCLMRDSDLALKRLCVAGGR